MSKEKNFYLHESSYIDDNVKIKSGTKIWHFSHIQTGAMIASLSKDQQDVGNNVIESVTDIKKTMSSILQTLQAQDEIETKRFLREMRELESEKRRKREKKLEVGKKVGRSIQKTLDRALSPVKNIFSAIFGGFVKLFLGKALISLLNFFIHSMQSFLDSFLSINGYS